MIHVPIMLENITHVILAIQFIASLLNELNIKDGKWSFLLKCPVRTAQGTRVEVLETSQLMLYRVRVVVYSRSVGRMQNFLMFNLVEASGF